ncbi:DUF4331 family protein [Rhizobium cauense]|nr:DUF4331 family protein [Rhizobium cauense]
MARQDIRLDITDLYVFRGEVGTVFAINVCHSIFGPIPSPGFHPEGMYEIKIDLNNDAVEDITYRLTFGDRNEQGEQGFVLRRIAGGAAADPNEIGDLVLEGKTGEEVKAPDKLRIWAGKAGDPFWIDPDVLHAVGHAFEDGTAVDLKNWSSKTARNLFAGHTVYSIVLEVPDGEFRSQEGVSSRLGIWAVSTLATDAGGWRSVNRIGLPMIHPLFTQFNGDLGNRLNAGIPTDDFAMHGESVIKAVSGVVGAYGTAEDPRAYAERLARRLFPNILPYTLGTPAIFGFSDWNGRSLTDNVADVMFSIAANTPIRLGIGKETVIPGPSKNFPYVPLST